MVCTRIEFQFNLIPNRGSATKARKRHRYVIRSFAKLEALSRLVPGMDLDWLTIKLNWVSMVMASGAKWNDFFCITVISQPTLESTRFDSYG
jgi:hypothetical protein